MKKIIFDFKSFLFLILILIPIYYSTKHTLISSSKFILSNITIRESFLYPNDINFKGTHAPGKRFINLLMNNYYNFKTMNIAEIIKTLKKIRNINIMETDYFLEYELIKTLNNLSKLSIKEKKYTAVYIPKNIKTYWNLSCDTLMTPFVAPAIANMVMLRGLPINNIESCYGHRREYGYARYKEYKKNPEINHLNPEDLCQIAKKEGLIRVIELVKSNNKYNYKIYNCNDDLGRIN